MRGYMRAAAARTHGEVSGYESVFSVVARAARERGGTRYAQALVAKKWSAPPWRRYGADDAMQQQRFHT